MNEFVFDVINNAAGLLRRLKMESALKQYQRYIIFADDHSALAMLTGPLYILKKNLNISVELVQEKAKISGGLIDEMQEQWEDLAVWDSFAEVRKTFNETDKICFLYGVNLRKGAEPSEEFKENHRKQIRELLEFVSSHKDSLFQLVTCISPIAQPLPEGINALAEREYEVFFRDYPAGSPEKFGLELEELCRNYIGRTDQIKVIRLDRVFGPGVQEDDGAGILPMLDEVLEKGSITVEQKDRHQVFSASYIRDALGGILLAALNGRKGNIYHVSSWEYTLFEFASHIYGSFPEISIRLEVKETPWEKERAAEYFMLNARKLRLTHRVKLDKLLYTRKKTAVEMTARWRFQIQNYVNKNDINVYYGRMNRIREMELGVLKEIDRICKENHIKYFLAGGSMLGAVRHHGFIPWDDDVDIAMLPEDYQRFLEVCPDSLKSEYGYQNFKTEPASHYIHDKIRIKDTFFSTKYSDKYAMMNGVYVDVFVYYKTSDIPWRQKWHLKKIQIMRRIIGIRWADRPRKNIHYYFSKVALPIMRLFPFMWLHKYYMRILNQYEKKDTHFRIDATGFNLKKVGAFPAEWFEETIEWDFCGMKLPILKRYDDYLKHWYGERYMDLLPISARNSVHDVVRIDLGEYLNDRKDSHCRHVDLRGELYEQAIK